MKKCNPIKLLFSAFMVLVTFYNQAIAGAPTGLPSQKIIHYWDFNQSLPYGGGGAKAPFAQDSLGTAILPLYPDYSNFNRVNPSASGAVIRWYRPQGVQTGAKSRDSIIDNGSGGGYNFNYAPFIPSIAGDSVAQVVVPASGSIPATYNGNCFVRTRNPVANGYFYIGMPTTNFKNIHLNFELSGSSTAMANYLVFQYSTNGGLSWTHLPYGPSNPTASKLASANYVDTFNISGVYHVDTLSAQNAVTINSQWYPVSLNFDTISAANNNPGFMIRFQEAGANNVGASGNARFDNFVVLGDTLSTAQCITTQVTGGPIPYQATQSITNNAVYVCTGASTNLSVTAIGSSLSYQWQSSSDGTTWANISNGGVYSGATTANLAITGITSSQNNVYYHCVVTSSCNMNSTNGGTATSQYAYMNVISAPITTISGAGSVCSGTKIILTAAAGMSSYSWSYAPNGVTTSLGTTASINFTPVNNGSSNTTATYSLTTSACSSTLTGTTVVTTKPTPIASITGPAVTGGTCAGSSVTLTATGNGALANAYTYSWKYTPVGGTATTGTSGAADSTFTNSLSATAGSTSYTVTVTNTSSACTATTSAKVSGYAAAGILTQPVNDTVCSGRAIEFGILPAANTGTLAYQWQVNKGAGFVNLTSADSLSGFVFGPHQQILIIPTPTTTTAAYTYKAILTSTLACFNNASVTSNSVSGVINDGPCVVDPLKNPYTMIHFWHFNNTLPYNGSPAVTVNDLNNIYADYSALGGAFIQHVDNPAFTDQPLNQAIVANNDVDNGSDVTGADTVNFRKGYGKFVESSYIRFRNPSDGEFFYMHAPTTYFNNLHFSFGVQVSSASGPQTLNYSYSVDGGTTWESDSLQVAYYQVIDESGWKKGTLNLSNIKRLANNPNLVLGFTTGMPNIATSGNIRWDNVVLEGTVLPPTVASVTSNATATPLCSGDSLALSATAAGIGPFTYAWTGLGNFNSTTTAAPKVQGFESGNYSVIVSNAAGASPAGVVAVTNALPSDLNYDAVVDIADFNIFAIAFGGTCTGCPADINQDGTVNITDFNIFAVQWASSCTK